MNELCRLRDTIDQIDMELVALFEKRMETVIQVAEYKRKHKLPVLNAGREEEVLKKCCGCLNNPEYVPVLIRWMELTMALSREVQENYL